MLRPRAPRLGLAALVVALVAFAVWTPWRAVNGVDNRTYVEMIAGIRDHGLPSLPNAWSDRLPEAAPEFNVPAHGMLWGEYPPLYPYVAAPALALGGLAFVYKEQVLLIALLAVLVHRLARSLSPSPHAGLAAALLTVLGTPLYAGSFQTLALPLASLLVVGAVLSAIAALHAIRPFGAAMRTGVLGGLAVTTHLLTTPMTAAIVVVLAALLGARETGPRARALAFAKIAGAGATGWVLPLVPVAILNQWRFGNPHPLAYPCRWQICRTVLDQSLSAQGLGQFALPALPLFAAAVAGVLLFRARPRWAWAWLAVCFGAMLAVPALRFSAGSMLANLWAYFVDPSPVHLAQLDRMPDGVGWLRSGNAVKGFLQSCPIAACALAAGPGLRGLRARRALAWAPILGLFVAIAPLARFPGAFALGWPYLFSRYALYAAPLLVALGVAGALRRRLGGGHVVAFALLAGLLVVLLVRDRFDLELARRLVLLRGTLLVAVAAGAAALWQHRSRIARRALLPLAIVAAALSVGVSSGVDAAISVQNARGFDRRLERMERVAPARFALVGWGAETNPILALRAERDVEYVDFFELQRWEGFRALLDHWAAEGRPVFAAMPPPDRTAWPFAPSDVPLVLVDAEEGYWRVGPPARPAPP